MRKLLAAAFLLLPFKNNAHKKAILIDVPISSKWLMSDTSTTSTGSFVTATAVLKRSGFIVFTISTDSLNQVVTYRYLDASKKPLASKYCVWNSKEKISPF